MFDCGPCHDHGRLWRDLRKRNGLVHNWYRQYDADETWVDPSTLQIRVQEFTSLNLPNHSLKLSELRRGVALGLQTI